MNMKRLFFLTLFLTIIMIGCKENPVQEYGSTLSNSLKQSKDVAVISEISNIKKAVQSFSEERGRLPQNIEEVERFIGRPIDKEQISYNPETGEVTRK